MYRYFKKIGNADHISLWKSKKLSDESIKVGISHSEKKIICFKDSPSKMIKNCFYFILKAIFVLKIFKFSS